MKINISQGNEIPRIFVLFCFILLGPSCNRLSLSSNPTPTSAEPAVYADCIWKATGKAWNDDNKNGIWDTSEKPLANVLFWVDDPLNHLQKVNDFPEDNVPSNAEGNAAISVWLPGCPSVEFEVYTEAPQNCKLTTDSRISADPSQLDEVFSFGFYCD
jgi:hypothetical protein